MASTVSFLYIFNIRQNSRIYWLHSPLGINLTAFVSIPICLTPLTSCILPFHSPLLDYYQPVSLCILLLNTCKTLTIFLGNITYYIQNPFLSFPSQGRGAVCRWLHTLPSLCFWKQLVFAALLNLVFDCQQQQVYSPFSDVRYQKQQSVLIHMLSLPPFC